MKHSFLTALCLAAVSCVSTTSTYSCAADSPLEAAGWSEFHGPSANGFVPAGAIPDQWTDRDYTWRSELGGRDVGSPVVAGQQIFVLASDPQKQEISVRSLSVKSGRPLWSKSFQQAPHKLHKRNTFASSTPAADATHVFVSWADSDHTMLKCFDHQGNQVWSRDFGSWQSQHGFGTSPRIFGSLVLLMNSQQASQLRPGQEPGESRIVAVDRTSGETVWETGLTTTRSCYGVPAIYTPADGGPTQIINANTGDGMFGLDAKTGKMLWSQSVFRMRCCSTPLIVGDIAIASSGSGGGGNHLVAVRIPKDGGTPEEVYRLEKNAPYVPTPAIKDGLMFVVSDAGIASCVDAASGETHWVKRIGGNFGASPVIVGDKLLLVSLSGVATVVAASSEFQKLGESDLGGPVGATPAYIDGRLLIRVDDEIRCLGGDVL